MLGTLFFAQISACPSFFLAMYNWSFLFAGKNRDACRRHRDAETIKRQIKAVQSIAQYMQVPVLFCQMLHL